MTPETRHRNPALGSTPQVAGLLVHMFPGRNGHLGLKRYGKAGIFALLIGVVMAARIIASKPKGALEPPRRWYQI